MIRSLKPQKTILATLQHVFTLIVIVKKFSVLLKSKRNILWLAIMTKPPLEKEK